jgi:hypothetical protein
MRDLKRIEDNLFILDHEMRPNVTIGVANDDEWDHPTVSAGISVNTQLIRR